jgi:hypothetical protein
MTAGYALAAVVLLALIIVVWDLLAKLGIPCRLFGHKPQEETYSGAEYMEVSPGAIDGIGREHATLHAKCARCNKKYRAGQIHLPERYSEKLLKKKLQTIREINQSIT